MPTKDTSKIKEEIVSVIKRRGPSLPIQIAGEIKMNTLFTSAFLSELVSDRIIKVSDMRVGSSPIYFLEGQEPSLEKFSQYLKSKEKEAFLLLKEKKILRDDEQEPAIRVALRAIKDFAIPLKKDEELIWRYFTAQEQENEEKKIKPEEEKIVLPVKQEEKIEIVEMKIEKKENRKKTKKKNVKQDDKFFNKVKDFLSKELTEILDIVSFNKNEIVLKVKKGEKEKILVAYNKKRITEKEIINAYKKSLESELSYIILSLGELPKKVNHLFNAVKALEKIGIIEEE